LLDQLTRAGRWLLGDDAGVGKEILEGLALWQRHDVSLSDVQNLGR